MTPDPELLSRLAETEYMMFDDGIHSFPTPFGTFITHQDFPDRWDCNQLVRCQCKPENLDTMLMDLEHRYATTGASIRKLSGHDSDTDHALMARLPGMGWRRRQTLAMLYSAEPGTTSNPEVEVHPVDPRHPDLEKMMMENGRIVQGFAFHRSQTPRLGGEWLLGYLEGKPAGTTGWFIMNEIARYRWVGTAEWARHRGVATTLIRYVQNHPLVKAADALTIHVSEDLPEARRLYERLGFRPAGWLWDWMRGA